MPPAKPPRQIDWEAVWKSLNWDDEQRQQSADQERLRQRAQHYAAPVKEQKITEDTRTVLTFDLGTERYGIDVICVRGIRALGTIARVPGAPPFYQGVLNVRGRIITVMDLRSFFQIPYADEGGAPDEVVIVHAGKLEIGLLAHQVMGVESIPTSSIKSVEHMPYAHGLTSDKIVLLDMAQLFHDERLIVGGASE